MFNYNSEIERILTGKNGLGVPVSFMHYDGDETSYVVYMQMTKDNELYGDDGIVGCVEFYDFDVYSKGNFFPIVSKLIDLMTKAGWTYSPSRDSPDLYESDSKYYHKTICICKEATVNG